MVTVNASMDRAARFIVLLPVLSRQCAKSGERRTKVHRGTLHTVLKK